METKKKKRRSNVNFMKRDGRSTSIVEETAETTGHDRDNSIGKVKRVILRRNREERGETGEVVGCGEEINGWNMMITSWITVGGDSDWTK